MMIIIKIEHYTHKSGYHYQIFMMSIHLYKSSKSVAIFCIQTDTGKSRYYGLLILGA